MRKCEVVFERAIRSMRVVNFGNLQTLKQNQIFTIPIDNGKFLRLLGAAQSNKILSIIPLIKRIVRAF